MPDDPPLTLTEVLAEEYRALRPGSRFDGETPEELHLQAHREPEPLAALSISGGGIRSATFALGVVQGLAERGLLGRFDYLSTVSGGGYLGGWLTAWAERAGGLGRIVPRLRRDAPAPAPGEPDPIGHLREYNSYLAPRRGALSADTWTLVATVLRNVLLNWLVLLPLLLAAALLPRLYLAILDFPEILYGNLIFAGGGRRYDLPALDAVSGSPWVAWGLPLLSAALFATALLNILRYLPGLGGCNHSRGDFLTRILAPLLGAVFAFLAFDSLFYLGSHYTDYSNVAPLVAWTVVPSIAAWLLFLLVHRGSLGERLRLLFGPLSLAIAFLAAGTGLATWLVTNEVLWNPEPGHDVSWGTYVTLGPPLILLGFCLGAFLFVGLSSHTLGDEDREWMSRAVANVLIAAAGWTALSALVLLAPPLLFGRPAWLDTTMATLGAASGWLAAFGSSRAAPGDGAGTRKGTAAKAWIAAKAAPPLFLALLAVGISLVTDELLTAAQRLPGAGRLPGIALVDLQGQPVPWRHHQEILHRTSPALLVAVGLALLVLSWIAARYVNINTFSLHGMYRDRLIRAYLGASNPERSVGRFTGFAPDDDLPLSALAPEGKPLHVVNMTLNVLATSRLAWQERKAQPFSASPLHCGSGELGYRPTADYGGPGGLTLGTAVALSGAAASPSMGYHSSALVSLIMTLFNARLGSWLGNPGAAGTGTWRHDGPRSAVRSLLREALGLTSDRSGYVYLSDGGHFENLGLYEMVRRRCRWIVVVDGACDADLTYHDLGNALRKIRIDLGIPILFEGDALSHLRERHKRCAVARVRYSAVDGPCEDGFLLYLKPVLLGDEPPDVESYARDHPQFPHQTTADQWFDESQTESYRMLGLFTVDELCRGFEGGSFEAWLRHLEGTYLAPPDGRPGTTPAC